MIKFSLHCERGHEFESWFPDGESYETQARRGLVQCAFCDSVKVEKALMAPAVHSAREPAAPSNYAMVDPRHAEVREAIRDLRRKIEANTTDVGARFPEVARAMHLGDEPDRPIRGQATAAQARELLEEGVGVLPIPSLPEEAN
jgi:hypothetical protein